MGNQSLLSGWNSTDGGSAVPVRGAAGPQGSGTGIGGDIRPVTQPSSLRINSERKIRKLSALTGIVVTTVLVGFYFGMGNLRGDVSDSPSEVTVTITEDGTFEPAMVTVDAGKTLTFVNANKNPQVLKTKDSERELFPVQVIFTDPVTADIPASAFGTYFVFSETLPDDRVLTINVKSSGQSTPFGSTDESELDIPLPFGDSLHTAAPVVPSSSSSSAPTIAVASSAPPRFTETATTEHSGETVIISLGQPSEAPVGSASIEVPTNPHTVSQIASENRRRQLLARQGNQEVLHSGAPLQDIRTRPKEVTETGPEGTLLLVLPALVLLGFFSRRAFSR